MADAPQFQSPLTAALAGRYDLIRELGRGGMATVYLARDVKHDREVAIKVLLPELSASLGAERFEREIRVAARLQHPHILGLFDSGVAEGQLFYVMPFVKGESLRDRINREGMLPLEDALQIALEVNDALGHAHGEGIVHRDIKPENILLSGGHALVADFGIARAVADGGGSKLTQTGMSMGTPYYMSPEQFAAEPVGPSSDLYALACVLYEMLAGEPPFTGKTSVQLMAKHAMEQVPSIRILRSVVPEDVENAIFVTMNKNPADRPQNAEQFAQLLGIQSGNTASMRVFSNTMSRRVPSGAQTLLTTMADADLRPWRRLRPAIVGVAVLVVVAFAATWWTLSRPSSAVTAGPEARRLAILYFSDLSRDSSLAPLADGLTEGLIRTLSTASSFEVVSATGAARFRNSPMGVDSISLALRVGYVVRGEVEPEGDRVRISVKLDDASGVNLKRESLAMPAANVLGARDTLVVIVSDLIRQQLGEQFQISEQRASTSNADSWLLVQRGEAARKAMDAAAGDTVALDRHYRAADSLFAAAAAADRRWAEPDARRALIAYRRSRLSRDAGARRKWVAVGHPHAANALKIDPDNADALEVRGNLFYWSWLSNLEEDVVRKAALIDSAKSVLERATAVNTRQAGAYSTLSHLYNNHPKAEVTDVLIAAQRAYESDEFLSDAELVLSRLVLAAYDLGQSEKADQWCGVARTRFPKGYRSFRCQLLVLTMPRPQTPNIQLAWLLADSLTAVSPDPKYFRLNSDMLVGAVIARASKSQRALADSARRVIKRSEGDELVDPTRDLALYGAIGYTVLDDKADAIRLLKTHLAVNPQKIPGFRDKPGWQYKDLESDPAYRQLVGAR